MDAPLSPQISPSDPAADASALASLAVDAAEGAIPSVDGAASVAASDGTAPADDSRAPTAPQLMRPREHYRWLPVPPLMFPPMPLLQLKTRAPPQLMQRREQYRRLPGPPSMPLFHLQKRAPSPPPPPTQWGNQYHRSLALLQVPPPMPRPLTMLALPPHPTTTQWGRHGCPSPLQPQVLLQKVSLPSAPTAAVPPTGRTSASPCCPTEAIAQKPSPR